MEITNVKGSKKAAIDRTTPAKYLQIEQLQQSFRLHHPSLKIKTILLYQIRHFSLLLRRPPTLKVVQISLNVPSKMETSNKSIKSQRKISRSSQVLCKKREQNLLSPKFQQLKRLKSHQFNCLAFHTRLAIYLRKIGRKTQSVTDKKPYN